jgi:hypothetical protein
MTVRGKNENDMPDVPDPDFIGTLCEIWFAINYAAYHLAYVRVYLQTEALQTHGNEIRQAESETSATPMCPSHAVIDSETFNPVTLAPMIGL